MTPRSPGPAPRHALLFGLLGTATLFEGFDTKLAALVAPFVDREFGSGAQAIARAQGWINLGAIAAVLPIALADRFGRRPVMLAAIAGYCAFTLATSFSRTLEQFVALQFLARLFMVTELALVYVWIAEELPEHWRGRASGAIGALAFVGAQLPALGLWGFAEGGSLDWRSLYWIGGALLPALPLYWIYLREPSGFVRRELRGSALRGLGELWQPQLRLRLLAMSGIWFTLSFAAASGLGFVSYFVVQERGWSPRSLAALVPAAGILGALGYAIAGQLADRLGRQRALAIYLALGFAASALCFGSSDARLISAGYVLLNAASGSWAIAATLCAELFPSELRATATALSNNLLGRVGMVAGPLLIGMGVPWLGSIGAAALLLSAVQLLCLPLVLRGIPGARRDAATG